MSTFPHIDAATQDAITDEQADFFRRNGLLVVRNLLRGEELARLQAETRTLVDRAVAGTDDPDFFYQDHPQTKQRVPFRVEYVADKRPSCKALLGHPFVLRSVEKLQGRDFIPTWDSMVFKNEGAGAPIAWHRDAGTGNGAHASDRPIFNVDFYLDEADLSNCLWGIPGSNQWDDARAQAECARRNADGGFDTAGAVPIPMQPGDVIWHNILALHGSPPTRTKLRRVIYYEFRPGEIERAHGPHAPEYIPRKQEVLLAALGHRARAPYARTETPFAYRPSPAFAPPALPEDGEPRAWRYPHHEWWRREAAATG